MQLSWKTSIKFAATFTVLALASPAKADFNSFATFNEVQSNNPFVYTPGHDFGSATFNVAQMMANFNYLNISGLPADLAGTQNAIVAWTSSSTGAIGTDPNNPGSGQPFSGTVTISRATPANEGSGSRTKLLTMVFTGNLVATGARRVAQGGDTLDGYTVTYSSDFLTFLAQDDNSFNLELTPRHSVFPISNGNYKIFEGVGTASFDAAPLPVFVPEPASLSLAAIGLLGVVGALYRRRRKA